MPLTSGSCFDGAEERLEDHAGGVTDLGSNAVYLDATTWVGAPLGPAESPQGLVGRAHGLHENGTDAALHIIHPLAHVSHARAGTSSRIAEE